MANENKAAAIANDKEGYLYLHQEEKKSLKKFFCVLSGNLFIYGSNQKDKGKEVVLNILVGFVVWAKGLISIGGCCAHNEYMSSQNVWT